jgi:transcriptional regulator with XRE-family HTH domain
MDSVAHLHGSALDRRCQDFTEVFTANVCITHVSKLHVSRYAHGSKGAQTMVRSGLGAYIKAKRTALGMTQRELAEAIGANDRTYVTQVERGAIGLPQSPVRQKIARALHVRELDLLIAAGELPAETTTAPLEPDRRLVALLPALSALSDDNLHVVATVALEILKNQNKGGTRDGRSPHSARALA